MNNLDKKIISILLIVSMLLISLSTVVKATDDNISNEEEVNLFADNSNPALKTNTESAKLYWDHVLTASGDLYCINYNNPAQKMDKVDTNVAKYVYGKYTPAIYTYKNSNKARVVNTDDKGNKTSTTLNNIKDVGISTLKAAYLTTNNELYTIHFDNNNWKTEKIATGVTELIDSLYYYKDGKTYDLVGMEVYNGKIDKGYYFGTGFSYFSVGNVLYRHFNDYIIPYENDFSQFDFGNYQVPLAYKTTTGGKKGINAYASLR